MSTREKVEELLADVLPRLEALKDEALAGIEEVREDATRKIARYEAALAELAEVEAEIEALSAERSELPSRTYVAGLNEDYELEDELKVRYKNLRPAIEGLEDRRASLKGEIERLCPRGRGHRYDAMIEHISRVAGTAAEERRILEEMRDRLVKALDATVEPVAKLHNDNRALVETRSRERSWEEAAERRAQVGA